MKHHPRTITAHRAQDNPMLSISDDGCIRLTYAELQQEQLIHLVSGLDEDTDNIEGETTITGYTEWVTDSAPIISMGWDWKLGTNEQLIRISDIRSNVMLLNHRQIDHDAQENNALLEQYVDDLNWQITVKYSIYQRHTH
jgi:hypothetical protein